MGFCEKIEVAAVHRNDVDTALAYCTPSRGGISDHPIVKLAGPDKYNSSGKDLGAMSIDRVLAVFGYLDKLILDRILGREHSFLNAGRNILENLVRFQAPDNPRVVGQDPQGGRRLVGPSHIAWGI